MQQLLEFWNERKIYSKDYIGKLREVVISGARGEVIGEDSTSALGRHDGSRSKTMPFVMPAMHGDPSTPWFDLPAGNMMPHIMPNSTRAINPVEIKPLRFVTGPADENLAFAVKTFLNEVDTIFGIVDPDAEIDESILDFDEVGQAIVRDEITKEVLEGEGYYGWSRQFCEKMRRRKLRNDPSKFMRWTVVHQLIHSTRLCCTLQKPRQQQKSQSQQLRRRGQETKIQIFCEWKQKS